MGNRPTTDAGRFRSVPERSPDFAHLSLDGLRAYRRALSEEEGRGAYWRRIIQARLALVPPAEARTVAPGDKPRGAFSPARVASRRKGPIKRPPARRLPP